MLKMWNLEKSFPSTRDPTENPAKLFKRPGAMATVIVIVTQWEVVLGAVVWFGRAATQTVAAIYSTRGDGLRQVI